MKATQVINFVFERKAVDLKTSLLAYTVASNKIDLTYPVQQGGFVLFRLHLASFFCICIGNVSVSMCYNRDEGMYEWD